MRAIVAVGLGDPEAGRAIYERDCRRCHPVAGVGPTRIGPDLDDIDRGDEDALIRAIVEPGLYVLQAGSFSRYEDSDRRRAELALQGIESSIQRVTIDDRTYHRVRIGPIDDLDQLNMLRSRLRAARIDALRIRLGD